VISFLKKTYFQGQECREADIRGLLPVTFSTKRCASFFGWLNAEIALSRSEENASVRVDEFSL
jgi:hypothetical protein